MQALTVFFFSLPSRGRLFLSGKNKVLGGVRGQGVGVDLLGEPAGLPGQRVHGEAHPLPAAERAPLFHHDPDRQPVPLRR